MPEPFIYSSKKILSSSSAPVGVGAGDTITTEAEMGPPPLWPQSLYVFLAISNGLSNIILLVTTYHKLQGKVLCYKLYLHHLF